MADADLRGRVTIRQITTFRTKLGAEREVGPRFVSLPLVLTALKQPCGIV